MRFKDGRELTGQRKVGKTSEESSQREKYIQSIYDGIGNTRRSKTRAKMCSEQLGQQSEGVGGATQEEGKGGEQLEG